MTRVICFCAMIAFAVVSFVPADEDAFVAETKAWQQEREQKLRGENGWLTLVGRYPLRDGANTFGAGKANDIVLPDSLMGVGPDRLGSIVVNSLAGTVTLRLVDQVEMVREGKGLQGEHLFDWKSERRDWVSLGRMSMHVTERSGKFFLRVADNESNQRLSFPGCTWFAPNVKWRVEAKYVPYAKEEVLTINNILGEQLEQPCCGYAEFIVEGVTYKLDAIREGEGLFFVFRDATAGESTYGGGRFIDIERRPDGEAKFILDFNRAYNPPCAFSKYTTCPLPPPQNVLKIRIEAGETLHLRP